MDLDFDNCIYYLVNLINHKLIFNSDSRFIQSWEKLKLNHENKNYVSK